MLKTLIVLGALCCLFLTLSTPVRGAAITVTSGAIDEVAPPSSVRPGQYESNTAIHMFAERQQIVLTGPLTVDITKSGLYDAVAKLTPTTLPAGTCVESHFLHFDNVGPTQLVRGTGSVTFDADVFGIILMPAK